MIRKQQLKFNTTHCCSFIFFPLTAFSLSHHSFLDWTSSGPASRLSANHFAAAFYRQLQSFLLQLTPRHCHLFGFATTAVVTCMALFVQRLSKRVPKPASQVITRLLSASADESGFVTTKEYQSIRGGGYRVVEDEMILDYETSAAILANSIKGSSYEGTVGGPRSEYNYDIDVNKPMLDYETSAAILMRSLEGSRYEGSIGGPRPQPAIDLNKPLFDYETSQVLLSRVANDSSFQSFIPVQKKTAEEAAATEETLLSYEVSASILAKM
jgi:hypothetical protein